MLTCVLQLVPHARLHGTEVWQHVSALLPCFLASTMAHLMLQPIDGTCAGFVVVAYDLRGHGLSGMVDGLPGYAKSFLDHVDDLLAVVQHASERHVGLPSFVMGESMGGARGTMSALYSQLCGAICCVHAHDCCTWRF